MKKINAYVNFNGKCREAMTFYKECLGGGELKMMTVAESPVASQLPSDMKEQVMHSTLEKDGLTLVGSDMGPGKYVSGNNIALFIDCSSEEEIDNLFSKLSTGGEITDTLKDQFWGGKFGIVTDKYGIRWMFNFDRNQ